jgi:drug/metabolite transporter (DMT)-like permease
MNLAASVGLALGAAACFAAAAVLQQRAARLVPASESLHFRLLINLLHRPVWLAGIGLMIGAYVAEAAALSFGTVALVEPLIAMELVFALPFAVRSLGRRPTWREWAAGAAVVAGVGLFLAVGVPTGGTSDPRTVTWALIGLPCAAAVLVLLAAASRRGSAKRASLLAAAAAICFALLALLTKSLTFLLSEGLGVTLTAWQPYALVGVGVFGFLFSQSSYQASSLESSLPIIDTVEPALATLLGIVGFHEHVAVDVASLAVEALGALLAVAGVYVLGRSALIVGAYGGSPAPTS